MRNLKIVVLFFLIIFAIPTSSQESFSIPNNGNGLFDFCSATAAELNHTASSSTDSVGIKMMKVGWCGGFVHAMRTMIPVSQFQQAKAIAITSGVSDPSYEVLKRSVSARPDFTCFPDEVNDGQLVQVLDKFLREHPAKLHESEIVLATNAFHDAFPCGKTPKRE